MRCVVTLVSAAKNGLNAGHIDAAHQVVTDRGAESGDREITVLSEGRAADIPYHGPEMGIADDIREALAGEKIDVFAGEEKGRRKQILLADMDSTIVQEETLDELAGHVGLKSEIAAITERAMRGELNFAEALRERVSKLEGLKVEAILDTLSKVTVTPGARELVATMRKHGAHCVLVSGGFDIFTRKIARDLGFHEDFGNRLEIEDDVLTGRVLEPIRDKTFKLKVLREQCAARELSHMAVLAVGDGANDLDMLKAAGMGVAFHAKPKVREAAQYRVEHGDLTALLYAQGYGDAAFA